MEEYLVITLGYFFLFLHKNIQYGYSLEAPCRDVLWVLIRNSSARFMDELRELS